MELELDYDTYRSLYLVYVSKIKTTDEMDTWAVTNSGRKEGSLAYRFFTTYSFAKENDRAMFLLRWM